MGDLSNEPSMEDILASIKKIIADDSEQKLSPPLARKSAARGADVEVSSVQTLDPPSEPEEADILELEAAQEEPVTVQAPEPALAAPLAELAESSDGSLVSVAAEQASRSALSSLSRLVVKPSVEGSDTLEGLVREMLKPMLKDWLDSNLPAVVERVVTQEVARIAGRGL